MLEGELFEGIAQIYFILVSPEYGAYGIAHKKLSKNAVQRWRNEQFIIV